MSKKKKRNVEQISNAVKVEVCTTEVYHKIRLERETRQGSGANILLYLRH